MISHGKRRTSSTATSVLPAAVGPTIHNAGGWERLVTRRGSAAAREQPVEFL